MGAYCVGSFICVFRNLKKWVVKIKWFFHILKHEKNWFYYFYTKKTVHLLITFPVLFLQAALQLCFYCFGVTASWGGSSSIAKDPTSFICPYFWVISCQMLQAVHSTIFDYTTQDRGRSLHYTICPCNWFLEQKKKKISPSQQFQYRGCDQNLGCKSKVLYKAWYKKFYLAET